MTRQPLQLVAGLAERLIDPASHSLTLADCRRPDMPLIWVNRGFENMTGYTREEAAGRNCRFLQGPETDRGAVAKMKACLNAKEAAIVDLLNYRKDGTTFWNRLSITPVRNRQGETTHFIGIQSDITRMRQLQDQLYEFALELGAYVRTDG